MNCPRCKAKMALRYYDPDEEKEDEQIWECDKCGFVEWADEMSKARERATEASQEVRAEDLWEYFTPSADLLSDGELAVPPADQDMDSPRLIAEASQETRKEKILAGR